MTTICDRCFAKCDKEKACTIVHCRKCHFELRREELNKAINDDLENLSQALKERQEAKLKEGKSKMKNNLTIFGCTLVGIYVGFVLGAFWGVCTADRTWVEFVLKSDRMEWHKTDTTEPMLIWKE